MALIKCEECGHPINKKNAINVITEHLEIYLFIK